MLKKGDRVVCVDDWVHTKYGRSSYHKLKHFQQGKHYTVVEAIGDLVALDNLPRVSVRASRFEKVTDMGPKKGDEVAQMFKYGDKITHENHGDRVFQFIGWNLKRNTVAIVIDECGYVKMFSGSTLSKHVEKVKVCRLYSTIYNIDISTPFYTDGRDMRVGDVLVCMGDYSYKVTSVYEKEDDGSIMPLIKNTELYRKV